MGMTIDESTSQIIDSLMGKKAYLLDHSDRVALTNALNTMRKYQKIEQIVSDFKNFQKAFNVDFGGDMYMKMVNEVVEDGNEKI